MKLLEKILQSSLKIKMENNVSKEEIFWKN